MTMKEDPLTNWIVHKSVTVNSKIKLNDLKRWIKLFIDFVQDLDSAKETDLTNFLSSIKVKYAIRTQNDIKAHLKNFIKWYYIDYSLRFRNLDQLCKKKQAKETYCADQMISKDELEKLVQGEPDLLWKAYFLTLFYSGCRPSEILNLKWNDIKKDNDGAFINVYVDKNKKTFLKFIPSNVVHYLDKITKTSDYVFSSKFKRNKGKPMTITTVQTRVINLSLRILKRKVTPYILRHSVATLLYNRDDIKDIDTAQHMGHSKEMRQTYVHLSDNELKKRMRKIWITAEDLPKDKESKYIKEISELKNIIFEMNKRVLKLENINKILHDDSI